MSARAPRRICVYSLVGHLQIDGFGSFTARIRLRFEGDAHPLAKHRYARPFNRRDMYKNVLTTLVRGDKTETLD